MTAAMIQRYPGGAAFPTLHQLEFPILQMSLTLVMCGVLAVVLGWILPSTPLFNRIVLNETITADDGFLSNPEDANDFLGRLGIAITPLRPSGSAMFDDDKIDVITHGDYIEPDTPIQIVEAHGSRIVVSATPPPDEKEVS